MKRYILLALGVLTSTAVAAESNPLKLQQTIPLPGVKGRFDHLAVDAKRHRLFVAALGNNSLEVIDLAAGKRIQSITGMAKPTGVLFLAESNRVLISNADDATLKILDGATLKPVKTLYSLLDPDNLRRDAKTGSVYVGYTDGALGLLEDSLSGMARSYRMPGHPESFQIESNGTRIFINVPKANQVAVLDRAQRKVVEKWELGEFSENFPMALNEKEARLFIGCRKPAQLVVLETTRGKLISHVPIAQDTDDLFYDAGRKRLYVSCGEGFVDVIAQSSPDKYERLATLETSEGARTSLFSPELDRYYLAVPARGQAEACIRVYQPQ